MALLFQNLRYSYRRAQSIFLSCVLQHERHLSQSLIDEFNKELEDMFGQPPTPFNYGSQNKREVVRENTFEAADSTAGCERDFTKTSSSLSHVDCSGNAQMVDVSNKPASKRVATASCRVLLGETAFRLVAANQIAKGDVLNVAKIAGINGAKHTSNLIPLCHNIVLSNVKLSLELSEKDHAVDIIGEVTALGQTGVEMEAMTAVSVAGLTVYDMCKAVSKSIQITNVQLEKKAGGKSGSWTRDQPDLS
eukprot:TRINITY_DN5069_c0_g1_i1.p1 TRINITY_DN5069_c0_g1~~TRINITY_DN5069_c0_g1_i1.p1  ORF type:complete len:249 (+),score=42.78 TRINITY_DN5069_c0_g1_i1:184-930(+)